MANSDWDCRNSITGRRFGFRHPMGLRSEIGEELLPWNLIWILFFGLLHLLLAQYEMIMKRCQMAPKLNAISLTISKSSASVRLSLGYLFGWRDCGARGHFLWDQTKRVVDVFSGLSVDEWGTVEARVLLWLMHETYHYRRCRLLPTDSEEWNGME